jgi:hypothetical protein
MDLKQRYVIKGINKEQTITSVVTILTSADGSKIEKVQDKWDGELPDGAIRNVSSVSQLLKSRWWAPYTKVWIWWLWSFAWYALLWMVRFAQSWLRIC